MFRLVLLLKLKFCCCVMLIMCVGMLLSRIIWLIGFLLLGKNWVWVFLLIIVIWVRLCIVLWLKKLLVIRVMFLIWKNCLFMLLIWVVVDWLWYWVVIEEDILGVVLFM